MMNWIKRWFTLPPQPNQQPSHDEIAQKTSAIQEGTDITSTAAHHQKRSYATDLLTLQKQARIIERSAIDFREKIDTAMALAASFAEDDVNKSKKKKRH